MPRPPRYPGGSSRLAWAAGALLVLLLVALAALQLRWLRAVAAADRQRLEAAVDSGLAALTADLDREVSRAWLAFRPPADGTPAEGAIAELGARWQETAPYPQLVADLFLVESTGGPPRARRLVDAARWEAATAPPAVPLRPLPDDGRGPGWRDRHEPLHRLPFGHLAPELPGLVVPLGPLMPFEVPLGTERWLVVVFDRGFLARELLPALAHRHLAPLLGDDLEMRVTVRGSGEVIYTSAPDLRGGFEWEVPLFDLLPPDELRRLLFGNRQLAGELGPPVPEPPFERGAVRERRGPRRAGASWWHQQAGWRLAARPAGGSLDAALARAHLGNTALALGILLLLALAAAALALSARRAQALARRQLEFTAAVSHELRTPLAAIRSLAENLADGLVREAEGVRLYGSQIASQGERLSTMVEEVLALAADPRGRPPARLPVDLAALVHEVVAEAAAALPGAQVDVDLPALPLLLGDEALLRRAVQNLLANALRHGGAPPWAAVRGGLDPGSGELRLAVIDRGPGVPAEERERLFEPFYRGQKARDGQVAGAGLGLHLARRAAEAHGGRIELASRADGTDGAGSTFTLVLPLPSGVPPNGGAAEEPER